jgi:hypothetical protein
MNDLYNETVTRNGKTYHYDSDLDIFYARVEEESPASKWAWVLVIVMLALGCFSVEYHELIQTWLKSPG